MISGRRDEELGSRKGVVAQCHQCVFLSKIGDQGRA